MRPHSFRPAVEPLEDRAVPALYRFTILPDVSSLSLSGNVAVHRIEEQGPGSLTTRFGGAVLVDFDPGAERISFLRDGTTAVAEDSGSWAPLPGGAPGTAPANYGGRVSVFGLGAQA